MSIKVMSRVWDKSKMGGTELLLLLALADHANDENVCWPGISNLARKTRKSERQVKRLLQKLEQRGELFVNRVNGRDNPNTYIITAGLTEAEIITSLVAYEKLKISSDKAKSIADDLIHRQKGDILGNKKKVTSRAKKVTSRAKKVTSRAKKGDIAMSPEPSINRQVNHQNLGADAPRGALGDDSKSQLMNYILARTGLIMPRRKSDIGFWWSSVGELLHLCSGDLDRAFNLVDKTISQMRRAGLTIATPNSLINPARALLAGTPGSQPGGAKKTMSQQEIELMNLPGFSSNGRRSGQTKP